MRMLHPVAAHEVFVARGVYKTFRADEALPITEAWSIHELQGSALFYRVDEDARDLDGLTILSEALVNPDGDIERYNVQSFNAKDPTVKLLKADYSFEADYVQIGRKLAGGEHEYSEFSMIENAGIYIKQTLFMGKTIQHVMAHNGKSNVFAPQLVDGQESQLQRIQAESLGTETLQVGRKTLEATKYQIADDVFYWLDEHAIPVQRTYTHNAVPYTVKLTDYAHRK